MFMFLIHCLLSVVAYCLALPLITIFPTDNGQRTTDRLSGFPLRIQPGEAA